MAAALATGAPVDLAEIDGFVDGAAVRRAGAVISPLVRDAHVELVTVPEGHVCTEVLELYQVDGVVAEPAEHSRAPRSPAGPCRSSRADRGVPALGRQQRRQPLQRGRRALPGAPRARARLPVEFPQEPGALRRFLDDVLGPDDDIAPFEHVERDDREAGAALTSIELSSAAGLPGLLERTAASPLRIQHLAPGTTAYRFPV